MDFFTRQDQARRKTKWLVVYFSLAVISMIVMVYGVAILALAYVNSRHHSYYQDVYFSFWHPELFAVVAVGTIAIIFCGSTYKTMALAGGGGAVAESLGGRLVSSNTVDPDERKLLNVVEEMSIASGVPMPQVYVLDDERRINAFAAGHSTSDAAVAVTHAAMKYLTRDELQGVIGHEFSHILNGDMRLNIRLIGILFGIFCLATIGRIFMSMRGGRNNPFPVIGILLLVVGSLGLFFGRLIQAAVSRQREYLADASSVQFTRNPAGLSGALQKIGGYGSSLGSPHASDASHMFFANGLGGMADSLFGAMATHPPLEKRIRAIDPNWDGKYQRLDPVTVAAETRRRPQPPGSVFTDGRLAVLGGILAEAQARTPPPGISSQAVMPRLGQVTPLHLKYAEALREALPDDLRNTARESLAAAALIYALLLAPDEKLRAAQIEGIRGNFNAAVADKTVSLFPTVFQVAAHARLPLVNLALGALKQLTPEQYGQFSRTLQWLINSDGRVELFEFVLQKIVVRHLAPKFDGLKPVSVEFYTVRPLLPDCAVILSALARVGSGDEGEIQQAFDTGAPYLRLVGPISFGLLPREQCGVDQINAALNRLAQAAPIIKKNFLEACAQVVGADGVIQEAEAELLRAVADTLDCPIPPLGVAE